MAVATKKTSAGKASNFVDFDEFIEFQLRKTRSGIHQTDVLTSGVLWGVFLLGYLSVFTVADHWIIPGGVGFIPRVILLVVVGIGLLAWGFARVLLPYLRHVNALYAAREIEKTFPDLKSSLLTWVDLRDREKRVPTQVLSALEKRAALQISHENIDDAVDRRALLRSAYVLLALVAFICAYTLLSPKRMSTSVWRAIFPTADVAVSTRTEILEITPGSTEILARDQVEVTAELKGVIPEDVTLFFTTADRRFADEPLVMRNTGEGLPRFRGRLTGENGAGLLQDVSYHVSAGDATSKTFYIRVIQPPSAAVTEVTYDYPEYMGLDRISQPEGNVDAWEGTLVTVRASTNMPVTKALLRMTDTEDLDVRAEEFPMEVLDSGVEVQFPLQFRSDGSYAGYYHIQVWNDQEQFDPQPMLHRIKIRPDLKPEVTLLHPTRDLEVPANASVPVAFEARDPDFLLQRVDLEVEKQGEVLPFPPPLYEAPPYRAEMKSTYRLELGALGLQPGEEFFLYIQAEDNRIGSGGMTRSSKVKITVIEPKPAEAVDRFEEEQTEQAQRRAQESGSEDQEFREPGQEPEGARREDEPEQPEQDEARETEPGEEQTTEQSPGEESSQEQQSPGETGSPSETAEGAEQQQVPTDDPDAEPGEGSETESGEGASESEQPEQRATEPGERTEERDDPGDGTEREPGERTGPRKERAEDDQALRELLEWNRRQQEQEQSRPPKPSEDGSEPDDSTAQDRDRGDQEAGPREPTPQEQTPGESREPTPLDDAERTPQEDGQIPGEEPTSPEQTAEPQETPSEPGRMPEQETDATDGTSPDEPQPMPGESPPRDSATEAPQDDEGSPPGKDPSQTDREATESRQQDGTPPGEPDKQQSPKGTDPSGSETDESPERPENEGTPQEPRDGSEQTERSTDQATEQQQREKPETGKPAEQRPDDQQSPETGSSEQQQRQNDETGQPPGLNQQSPKGPSGESGEQSGKGPSEQPSSDSPGAPPGQSAPGESPPSGQSTEPPEPGSGGENPESSPSPPTGSKEPGTGEKDQDATEPSSDEPSGGSGEKSSDDPSGGEPESGGPSGESEKGPQDSGEGESPKEGGEGSGGEGEGKGEGAPSGGQDASDSGARKLSDSPSSQGTKSTGGGGTRGGAATDGAGAASGDGEGSGPPAEAADLENRKKATNLALERLRDQLERGQKPQELMDELGFTDQDLDNFMQRLEERLADSGPNQTPESQAARRQFESLLKGIDYQSQGEVRRGGDGPREAAQGFGAANRPVPLEFRKQSEAYKRKLSRLGTNPDE